MKPIAIVPRPGHEIGLELRASILYLTNAEIDPLDAVIGPVCAFVWVEDLKIAVAVDTLRNAGLQATALVETDQVS
jgi:hypothetical protein